MVRISAISSDNPKSFQGMEAFLNSGKAETPVATSSVPYYRDPIREAKDNKKGDTLLENTFSNKMKAACHKYSNALSVYPAKGFVGSKNSNFYEFLSMGMFPYITGSLTFIALFNGVTKHFVPHCAAKARKYGFGMALGVIFYALAKSLAPKAISKPVAMKTGIDLDQPYLKVVNLVQSPEDIEREKQEKARCEMNGEVYDEDKNGTSRAFEYHTAFESVDFPRTDLLYNKKDFKKRNEFYDKIAEKNGFGTNLPDSDQEVRPFIKSVVTKAKTAQYLSQYLWAAVGVALGVQEPWTNLLEIQSRKYSGMSLGRHIKTVLNTAKDSLVDSCKNFWRGGAKGAVNKSSRYVGRALLGAAVLSTVFGVLNAVKNPYMKNNKVMTSSKVFDESKKVNEG